MRDELLQVLGRWRGRLIAVRAMESAALAATAAGGACACAEVSWAFAGKHMAAAVAAGVAPALAAAALAWASVRRLLRLSGAQAAGLAVIVVVIVAAATGAVAAGVHNYTDKLVLLAGVPLAALAGAAVAALRAPSLSETARNLDSALHANERLATAVELSRSDRAASPAAMTVYSQSLAVLRSAAHVGSKAFWRRTRATLGALGLSGVLCLAASLAPTLRTPTAREQLAALAAAVDAMGQQERRQVADQLAAQSHAAPDPTLAQALLAAAKALYERDPDEFRRQMERAQKAVPESGTPLAMLPLPGAGSGQGQSDASDADSAAPPAVAAGAPVVPRGVAYVYDPAYAAAHPTGTTAIGDGSAAEMPFDAAWAQAKARAARSTRDLPPEYRRLVQDYFGQ